MLSVSSDGPADDRAVAAGWLRPSDVLLAAGVTAAQLALLRAAGGWHQHAVPAPWQYLTLAAGGAALAVRRRFPVTVLAAAFAATFAVETVSHAGPVWLVLVAAFVNAVLAGRRLAAVASLLAGYLVSVWPPWLIGRPGGPSAWFALWLGAFLLVMLAGAELFRMRRLRAQAIARGREEELRRQATEERLRIARDLHDLVAHNISVINVQASTALHLMDRQPQRARMALATINDVSKQALVELRSVLGVLRQVDEAEPRSPVPGLAAAGELVSGAESAGLNIRVEMTGEQRALPADVDLAAYRIIQEALTNVARHAAGSAATVRIGYGAEDVVVEVENEAPPGAAPAARPALAGGGNGLAGMRERAAALQGTLVAGPRPGGGYRVRAWLPSAPAETPPDAGSRAGAVP